MTTIRQANEFSAKIFDELRKFNDQFEPKVKYKEFAFVAEDKGEFLGGLEGYFAWDVCEISNLIVLKRNRGIGTSLVEKVEAFTKENGVTKLIASTMNFQAPNFYQKMGFEEYTELPKYAGEHSCHYFIKRL